MSDPHRLSLAQISQRLASGGLRSVDVMQAYLDRIARFDSDLRCYIAVDAAGALAAAAQSDARAIAGERLGALDGAPIAIKDNIDVAGLPTTAGVGAWRGRMATQDADCVARLKAAGAIILGKLNMHEAALGATNDNPFYGRCQNPYKPGFTPGGSSGGSGAAVAASLCAAALGTDTMGSVRIPAGYCGVFGLKPSNGALSNAGVTPLARRLDCVGPLARSVDDLKLLWAALAPQASPAARIGRIVRLREVEACEQERSVSKAYEGAASLLEGLGLEIVERTLPGYDFSKVRRAGLVMAELDAADVYMPDLIRDPDGFSPGLRQFIAFGKGLSPAEIDAARLLLARAGEAIRALIQPGEALLLPVSPQAPFRFEAGAPATQADFTALANIAGLPALALPAGWSPESLPIGVQLVGQAGAETALLDLAQRLIDVLGAPAPPLDYA
jgi:aspartyl-tRNA(Asn)/glutamyl-tRNA(Gln) amidotransferase subunit A